MRTVLLYAAAHTDSECDCIEFNQVFASVECNCPEQHPDSEDAKIEKMRLSSSWKSVVNLVEVIKTLRCETRLVLADVLPKVTHSSFKL